jgi:hypothetical protein
VSPQNSDEAYSETETVARREAALSKMLATPHKPQEKIGRRPERRTFKKVPAPEKLE